MQRRLLSVVFLLLGSLLVSGCIVTPVYKQEGLSQLVLTKGKGEASLGYISVTENVGSPLASLSAIAVLPVHGFFEQSVRNQLCFLLHNGNQAQTNGPFTLTLNGETWIQFLQPHLYQVTDRRVLGTLNAHIHYLLRARNGKILCDRDRTIFVEVEHVVNEYASLSAVENAKARAAQELAEWIALDLAAQARQQ